MSDPNRGLGSVLGVNLVDLDPLTWLAPSTDNASNPLSSVLNFDMDFLEQITKYLDFSHIQAFVKEHIDTFISVRSLGLCSLIKEQKTAKITKFDETTWMCVSTCLTVIITLCGYIYLVQYEPLYRNEEKMTIYFRVLGAGVRLGNPEGQHYARKPAFNSHNEIMTINKLVFRWWLIVFFALSMVQMMFACFVYRFSDHKCSHDSRLRDLHLFFCLPKLHSLRGKPCIIFPIELSVLQTIFFSPQFSLLGRIPNGIILSAVVKRNTLSPGRADQFGESVLWWSRNFCRNCRRHH